MPHQRLLECFEKHILPFVQELKPEAVNRLKAEAESLKRVLTTTDETTICFLGHSNVGKSTLINALATGTRQVLPSGGNGGPLTALATEVRYGPSPKFQVEYHDAGKLNQIRFSLENSFQPKKSSAVPSGSDQAQAAPAAPVSTEPGDSADDVADHEKLARLIVTGNQTTPADPKYLADCIRLIVGGEPQWGSTPQSDDTPRIDRVRRVLEGHVKSDTPYVRSSEGAGIDRAFDKDLLDHAAGFLAPLIKRIQVWWPSEMLKGGLVLVDLPGTGIASDEYRKVTEDFVQNKARAVLAVVDKSGFTRDTVDLLSQTRFLTRLLASTEDRSADPCRLIVAVTKADTLVEDEWMKEIELSEEEQRPKTQILQEKYDQLALNIRQQASDQLAENLKAHGSNDDFQRGYQQNREYILQDLEVFPVIATEYRKLLLNNRNAPAQIIENQDQSGIPRMSEFLSAMARSDRTQREAIIEDGYSRLRRGIERVLDEINLAWEGSGKTDEEVARLRQQIDAFLVEKRKELDERTRTFRDFLNDGAEQQIRFLVSEAKHEARDALEVFLKGVKDLHWKSLQATVRRGGRHETGAGKRIDLPDHVVLCFQEPLAMAWSMRLLKEVKARTVQHAEDIAFLVGEFHTWAKTTASIKVPAKLLDNQSADLKQRGTDLIDVGKETIREMRELVKEELVKIVAPIVQQKCEDFVQRSLHIGLGVRDRMVELFTDLVRKELIGAISRPAENLLLRKFKAVRKSLIEAVDGWGNPLDEAAGILLEKHEHRLAREDEKKRTEVMFRITDIRRELDAALKSNS